MSSIGSRSDAGGDGIHDPTASFGGELVKDRFSCRSKRGKTPEFGAGAVRNTVKDNKKDLARGHSYGMVGRAV
jgi:hypothetical protein